MKVTKQQMMARQTTTRGERSNTSNIFLRNPSFGLRNGLRRSTSQAKEWGREGSPIPFCWSSPEFGKHVGQCQLRIYSPGDPQSLSGIRSGTTSTRKHANDPCLTGQGFAVARLAHSFAMAPAWMRTLAGRSTARSFSARSPGTLGSTKMHVKAL